MKRVLSVLLLAGCLAVAFGQEGKESSSFLFEEFQEVDVYFKNGKFYQEKMNYNIVVGKFYFLDRFDGNKMKVLSNPQDVNVIKFGNRVFYPGEEGCVEVLPTNPILYVQYCGHVRKEANKGAYGMESETSAIQKFGGVNNESGTRFDFEPDKIIVGKRYNRYWIEKKGKKKPLRNFKQFVKLYPEHKEALNEFIEKNEVDFDNVEQMKMLLIYAESL